MIQCHAVRAHSEEAGEVGGQCHVAIIGDGPAGLITLAVLRDAGLPLEAIAVYGDSPQPLARFASYTRAVRQGHMRSEADGHLRPRDFPDMALVDAWRSRSPVPLLASLVNAYTPPLDLLLTHAAELAQELDFKRHHVRVRVEELRRHPERDDRFVLFDGAGARIGEARHVILALGHAGLHWPEAALPWREHPCVAHAYQAPPLVSGERIVVLGGGMAAAHLWIAALDAGASVVALYRRPLRRQRLNAPRCSFSATGIDSYRRLGRDERRARLRAARGGSFSWRWRWEWSLWRARRAGRFVERCGELARIEPGGARGAGSPSRALLLHLADGARLSADRLICATGLNTGALGHPLIARLAATYRIALLDGMLLLDDDFTLPGLSRAGSVLAAVGGLARWALPVADTFVGMKYAARRLVPLVQGHARA